MGFFLSSSTKMKAHLRTVECLVSVYTKSSLDIRFAFLINGQSGPCASARPNFPSRPHHTPAPVSSEKHSQRRDASSSSRV